MSIKLHPDNVHDPLQLEIGDDWIISVQCTNSNGSPMDLTGVQAVEWKLVDPTTGVATYVLTAGHGILQPLTLGQCVVWLTKLQSATLAAKSYFDQFRVTTSLGVQSTQSRGRIDAIAEQNQLLDERDKLFSERDRLLIELGRAESRKCF